MHFSGSNGLPLGDQLATTSAAATAGAVPVRFGRWHTFKTFLGRLASLAFPRQDEALPPVRCTPQELAGFVASQSTSEWSVDDQTWCDLELDRYFVNLSAGTSVFGQQMLHRHLRVGPPTDSLSATRIPEMLSAEVAFGEVARRSAAVLEELKAVNVDVSDMLWGELPQPPHWIRHLWIVPCTLFVSLPLAKLTLWALLPLGVAFIASGWVQIRLFRTLRAWQLRRRTIVTMLKACRFWQRLCLDGVGDAFAPVVGHTLEPDRLLRLLTPHRYNIVAALSEYTNLFALSEYREFGSHLKVVAHERDALQRVYKSVATMEGLITLAKHIRSTGRHCAAELSSDLRITFTDLRNPLLPHGSPIPSLRIAGGGTFISGQNGVGKSTLLRSVGLNLVIARAFGYCFAGRATVPNVPVLSSMAVEDSLERGDSLYVAELKRARELLHGALAPTGSVIIVDEIFRGTNHLESVSAAAAVLHKLSRTALVLVSSHNLVLAPLLQSSLRPLCVVRPGPDLVAVQEGVLAETNGIALMDTYGMPPSTLAQARAVAQWLESYLVHPQSCPDLGSMS